MTTIQPPPKKRIQPTFIGPVSDEAKKKYEEEKKKNAGMFDPKFIEKQTELLGAGLVQKLLEGKATDEDFEERLKYLKKKFPDQKWTKKKLLKETGIKEKEEIPDWLKPIIEKWENIKEGAEDKPKKKTPKKSPEKKTEKKASPKKNKSPKKKEEKKSQKKGSPKKGSNKKIREMTVPELKQRAKELGKIGYSKMKKDELIALLTPKKKSPEKKKKSSEKKKSPKKSKSPKKNESPKKKKKLTREMLNKLTVPELKNKAKKRGLSGYSKMKKEEIVTLILLSRKKKGEPKV